MTTLDIESARQQLKTQGFVHIPNVLNKDEVASLQTRVEHLFETMAEKRSRQILYVDGKVPDATPHLDHLMHQWLDPHRYPKNTGTSTFLTRPHQWVKALLKTTPVARSAADQGTWPKHVSMVSRLPNDMTEETDMRPNAQNDMVQD